MHAKREGTLLESGRSDLSLHMMKHFLRVGSLLVAGLWLSGCALSVQGKGKGKGVDVQPGISVRGVPQSGQVPVK